MFTLALIQKVENSELTFILQSDRIEKSLQWCGSAEYKVQYLYVRKFTIVTV